MAVIGCKFHTNVILIVLYPEETMMFVFGSTRSKEARTDRPGNDPL